MNNNHWTMAFLATIWAILTTIALLSGCANDGEADSGADDDSGDDDDAVDDDADDDDSGDDDVVDDDVLDDDLDDDSADDDSDDDALDDDADDDADDDTTTEGLPTGLLVLGNDGEGEASWLVTSKGWVRHDIPLPQTPAIVTAGPSFFLRGETGMFVWNLVDLSASLGRRWMRFDAEEGWSLDTSRSQSGTASVTGFFLPDDNHLWSIESFFQATMYVWYFIEMEGHVRRGHLGGSGIELYDAMWFVDADHGLVSTEYSDLGSLWEWSAGTWTSRPLPPECDSLPFVGFALADLANGWAICGPPNSYVSRVMKLETGVWSEVPTPAGCEPPSYPAVVYGRPDHAIVTLFETDTQGRFWEFRDGQWSCRTLGVPNQQSAHAIVLDNDRVFIATNHGSENHLFEVMNDEVVSRPLPSEIERIDAVHFLGVEAPDFSPGPAGTFIEWR